MAEQKPSEEALAAARYMREECPCINDPEPCISCIIVANIIDPHFSASRAELEKIRTVLGRLSFPAKHWNRAEHFGHGFDSVRRVEAMVDWNATLRADRDRLRDAAIDVVTQYPFVHPEPRPVPAWIRNLREALAQTKGGS